MSKKEILRMSSQIYDPNALLTVGKREKIKAAFAKCLARLLYIDLHLYTDAGLKEFCLLFFRDSSGFLPGQLFSSFQSEHENYEIYCAEKKSCYAVIQH